MLNTRIKEDDVHWLEEEKEKVRLQRLKNETFFNAFMFLDMEVVYNMINEIDNAYIIEKFSLKYMYIRIKALNIHNKKTNSELTLLLNITQRLMHNEQRLTEFLEIYSNFSDWAFDFMNHLIALRWNNKWITVMLQNIKSIFNVDILQTQDFTVKEAKNRDSYERQVMKDFTRKNFKIYDDRLSFLYKCYLHLKYNALSDVWFDLITALFKNEKIKNRFRDFYLNHIEWVVSFIYICNNYLKDNLSFRLKTVHDVNLYVDDVKINEVM